MARWRITEVASYESARRHGVSNLNAASDGWRILRTILGASFGNRFDLRILTRTPDPGSGLEEQEMNPAGQRNDGFPSATSLEPVLMTHEFSGNGHSRGDDLNL